MSLLNFGVMAGDRDTTLKCLATLTDMLIVVTPFNEEVMVACQKNIESYTKGDISKEAAQMVQRVVESGKWL